MVDQDIVEAPDRVTVHIGGELDWSARLRVEPVVEQALEHADGRTVDIDLRGATFIDSSGVSLLIEATEAARTGGTELRILRPAPGVFRVFEVLGLDGVLPFADGPA